MHAFYVYLYMNMYINHSPKMHKNSNTVCNNKVTKRHTYFGWFKG